MSATAPTLLVLDAATELLHLGLCVGARTWRRALPGGAEASARLLPGLMALLDEAGIALRDVDAIGYGRGPGAFTGVRAACAVTQGLAFGVSKPVLALDTLAAVAEDARGRGAGDSLWVAVDARMGEAYAARYRHDGQAWQTLDAPALVDPAALAARVAGGADRLVGNSLAAHPAAWGASAASGWADVAPRAVALLALARQAWQQGACLDAADALPLYVRDKVALTTAERGAAALASSSGARA